MDWELGIYLIVAAFLAFVMVNLVLWVARRERRNALTAWAAAHGLRFEEGQFEGFDTRFPDFTCLGQGYDQYGYNAMVGFWNGKGMVAFDYHYDLSEIGINNRHLSAVIMESPVRLRPLFIRPERLLEKAAPFLSPEDINFESGEFSRKFYVSSPDRKWAYDVIHARTMEFLLASPVFSIKFSPTHVIAYRLNRFKPQEFGQAADVIAGILDRLPEYVVRRQGSNQVQPVNESTSQPVNDRSA